MEIAYAEEFVGTSAIRTIHAIRTIQEHVLRARSERASERDAGEHPQARACEFCSEYDLLFVFGLKIFLLAFYE